MPIPDGAGSFYATYRGLSGSVASVSSGQPLYAEELSSLSIAQGLYALQQEQSDRPDPDALASAPQYGQLAPGNEVVQDQCGSPDIHTLSGQNSNFQQLQYYAPEPEASLQ